MKKLILLLTLGFALNSNAQTYTFTKSNGAYSNLTGAGILQNNNWSDITKSITLPFSFKLWGTEIANPLYLTEYGSLSLDVSYSNEIKFLGDIFLSRGTGKSPVSLLVDGTTPNRIVKIEFRNTGFKGDISGLKDSAHVQCWLYETSNIIEYRYGPNTVKTGSWQGVGANVSLYNKGRTKYIFLEGDPLNPNVNSTNEAQAKSLTGMPPNGTIYKFTPPVPGGINEPNVRINIIQNKISLPASVEVKSINIYNNLGQIVQSVSKAEEADLSNLIHGIYFIVINTTDGVISEKKFL